MITRIWYDLKNSLRESYRIRCAVAHNGGFIDQETINKIPRFRGQLGKYILLTEKELYDYLTGIREIAEHIDCSMPADVVRKIEVNWLLQDLFDADDCLTARVARKIMAQQYKYFRGVPGEDIIAARFNRPLH